MTITYSIILGNLPEGASLTQNGDLFGSLSFDLPTSPEWTVNQSSFTYDEFDNVSITFDVAPNSNTNTPIDSLGIVNGDIPWGLIFDASLGTLTGQILSLIPSPGTEDSKTPKPIWVTPSSNLGTFDEFESVSTSISATPGSGPTVYYGLHNSHLPWGVVLDSLTGTISGTLTGLLPTSDIIDELLPKPTWVTPSGSLGTFNEFSVVSVDLEATPTIGNTIVTYSTLNSDLPWGLTLNTATGVISGTVVDLIPTDNIIDIITTDLPTWVTPSGSLGTFNESSAVNISLSATPAIGSTLIAYELIGDLPWGAILNNSTGAITGTLNTVNVTTVYTFQVRVIDDKKLSATREFSITVNNI